MCGIVGFSGDFSRELLSRMSLAQRHRGPDGDGELFDPDWKLGLAHRRLAIIDLAPTGAQPMSDHSGRYVVVFNGEIYNFSELRRELTRDGVPFRGASDTEVLVNLWCKLGPAALERLNGIFALAVWDKREHVLHLARDGMGVKPLYFVHDSLGVRFASEIKSLLQDPSVSRELDLHAIRDHLTYVYCPWPRTILKAVRKVAPGERIEIRDGRIVSRAQFYLLPIEQPIENWDMPTASKHVREQLRTAVHRQMVSDVPVGCFLSGGLDSSAIVAFAKEVRPGGILPCYTADADTRQSGFAADLPYAQRVAKHLGVDLNVILIQADIMKELDRMLWHLDEPLADPAAINLMLICQAARQDGIKVMLGGAGGDDLFTGYRRHYSLQMERWWSWLPRPLRQLMRQGTQRLPKNAAWSRRLSKLGAYVDRSADQRLLGYFRWTTPLQVEQALSDSSRAQIVKESGFCESLQTRLDVCPKTGAGLDRLNRMLFLEMSHFLTDHNLTYTDKLSMAVGVEARVPFLDPDLVKLSYQIPTHLKQSGRIGKAVFKQAMRGILPEDVIYRPKSGFGAPLRQWMLHDLKPMVHDLLSHSVIAARGIFDPNHTQQLLRDNASGKIDVSYMLFSMMCIERWCQIFLDTELPSQKQKIGSDIS